MDSSVNALMIAQHMKDRMAEAGVERTARELRPTPPSRPARRRRLRLRLRRRRVAV
jgi:hypothetical protein